VDREYALTLSSKGQVTLPAEVRRALELDRGSRLRLILHDDGSVELVRPRFRRIAEVAGIARGNVPSMSLEEMREEALIERWHAKQDRSR
jgi:antitoxin PrlF